MAGRVSYCLSMLLSAATSFCSSIAYCRNFFALLRFDWQIQACAWISFRLQEGVFDIELRERASPHCAFCFSSFSQFQLPLQSAVIQLRCQLWGLFCSLVQPVGYRIQLKAARWPILCDEHAMGGAPRNDRAPPFVRRPSASTWEHSVKSWRAGAFFGRRGH